MNERLKKLENGSTFDSNDINWLLKQAKLKQLLSERLEKLKNEYNENLADSHIETLNLKIKNKRYKQALEIIKSNTLSDQVYWMIDAALAGETNE